MKKSIIIISVISVILIIGVLFSTTWLTSSKEYIPIFNDTIYFHMTENKLKIIKGEPFKTEKNICDTNTDLFVFNEKIEGYDATVDYYFTKNKLTEVRIEIAEISYKDALNLVSKNKEIYSKRENYYYTENDNDNSAKFSISNGVNLGATGINYDFEYEFNKLTIIATYQI